VYIDVAMKGSWDGVKVEDGGKRKEVIFGNFEIN